MSGEARPVQLAALAFHPDGSTSLVPTGETVTAAPLTDTVLVQQTAPPARTVKPRVIFAWDCPRCAAPNIRPRLDPIETCDACAWQAVIE